MSDRTEVDAQLKRAVARVAELTKALEGVGSCATQCVCCEMHRRVALDALGYTVEITTGAI